MHEPELIAVSLTSAMQQALLASVNEAHSFGQPALFERWLQEGAVAVDELPPMTIARSTMTVGSVVIRGVIWRTTDGARVFGVEGDEPPGAEEAPKDWVQPLDRVTDADRAWFAAHPGSVVRIRRREVAEIHTRSRWMIVRQVTPGVRIRHSWPERRRPSIDEAVRFSDAQIEQARELNRAH